MNTLLAFLGRLMIALLFLISGANKLMDISGTDTMIRSVGLPGGLALLTGLFEIVGGLALVFGVATRFFAILLAAFCLVAAFFFHNNFTDPMQAANLLKNIAIAGGLLILTALDNVRWSFDAMRARRRTELAELKADHRAHDAEVRAARAEGAAAATQSAFGRDTRDTVVTNDGTVVRKRRWLF
jgi:putative oxidoreductase